MIAPIFPLSTIVLPGGRIPLQLFEPRYLDMLSGCLKDEMGFVIVLQERGGRGSPGFRLQGTYVRIVDFSPLENGLLGITVEGDARAAVTGHWQEASGLHVGDIQLLPEEPWLPMSSDYEDLVTVLQALVRHPAIRDLNMEVDYQDARAVGWRLTELLPLELETKQELLEMSDPEERLQAIQGMIETME